MSSPDNDTVPREGESRRGEVRSIRELTSTLSTMRAQSEGGRVLRASCSLIRYIHLIYISNNMIGGLVLYPLFMADKLIIEEFKN